MNSDRRHFTPQEKVAALKRHLLEKVPVSEICDELDIAPTLFYRWKNELFENGHVVFNNGRKAKALEDADVKKIQQLEAKLQRKNEVMAELMEAHILLKQDLGELYPFHRPLDISHRAVSPDFGLFYWSSNATDSGTACPHPVRPGSSQEATTTS